MIYGERKRTLPLGNADPRLSERTLADFQRWALRRFYTLVDFADYDTSVRARRTEPRRRCQHCSRSLPFGARSDSRFCSPNCRSVSYRRHARLAEHALKRRKCQSCRRLIPCRARADALFCSAACKQRAYREGR
jgi:hypothetical protein